jgi:hypothetical protein
MPGTRLRKIAVIAALPLAMAVSASWPVLEMLANATRPSPDGRWKVVWHCDDGVASDACSISLCRQLDGRVFFRRSTFPRYIQAVWNRNSTKCLLLDAPDSANTFLWLFRTRNQQATVEKLDYKLISAEIESGRPETHRSEPRVTRSGVEKITWLSDSELCLDIAYNNVSVAVRVETSTLNQPRITVFS